MYIHVNTYVRNKQNCPLCKEYTGNLSPDFKLLTVRKGGLPIRWHMLVCTRWCLKLWLPFTFTQLMSLVFFSQHTLWLIVCLCHGSTIFIKISESFVTALLKNLCETFSVLTCLFGSLKYLLVWCVCVSWCDIN